MRTICNPVPQKDLCLPIIEDGKVKSWQSIVLFEHVLDGERILTSPEINKLLRYFYEQAKPSVVRTNYTDDLQFRVGHELYEADDNEENVIYPFKTSLEEMRTDDPIIHNGEYSGPLNVVSFKPDEHVEKDFLAITCKWHDELFRNDSYDLGLIDDTDDLYGIIEPWVIN